VEVGPYAVLGRDVELGDRVRVGAHAVVGEGSVVGEDTVLHPHAVLYPGARLGRRVIVHSGARVASDGFGYAFRDGEYRKIPQVGGCVLEDDVEIGANATVDRGSIGDTVVGRGSKLDNLVHLAHNVRVGPRCAMAAQVGIAGSTRIGEGVVFGGQSGASGHLEVGDGAKISAGAGVIGNVADGHAVSGFPARDIKQQMRAWAWMLRLPELARRVRTLERTLGIAATGEGASPDRA
jgi:UDP-3-O-[3-hydroxymyristoyl] glucosamine N-acyltransferase